MKKASVVLIIYIILFLCGCSNGDKVENKDSYFYIGQGNSWLATYTISNVKSSYYDSLSIQYLFDDNPKAETEKIGPIEYELTGNSITTKSTSPQELQGVANFHVGSRMNANLFQYSFDKEIGLTVKWKNKSEIIKLIRQD